MTENDDLAKPYKQTLTDRKYIMTYRQTCNTRRP